MKRDDVIAVPSREQLMDTLYEAADLEHNLMCTYLYAAFSLRSGETEGLFGHEAEAVAGWRRTIIGVAIEEMGHLAAVWNITSALGGSPRFGRGNFPLDPGALPAGVVVKLAPFGESALQHFIHLERPPASVEPEGDGFSPVFPFTRSYPRASLTPMRADYETIGAFYASLGEGLGAFVVRTGESAAFCGDPALQLSEAETNLAGARRVVCEKSAQAALRHIVEQGEGALADTHNSHFQRFQAIRDELTLLKAANPAFEPALPAAANPVLRRPVASGPRVWIENEDAAATVDLANACYALMLRLMAYSYVVPSGRPQKALAVHLGIGLMHAVTPLAERAARLPAGPSHPGVNAGMTFSTLRDAAPLPPGNSAARFFVERIGELAGAADSLARSGDARAQAASRVLTDLAKRAAHGFEVSPAAIPTAVTPGPVKLIAATAAVATPADVPSAASTPIVPNAGTVPVPVIVNGTQVYEGKAVTVIFDWKKCIHSRNCVTGAPTAFLDDVKGSWIRPDAIGVDELVRIAQTCPSGALRYRRKDGKADESAPPVNLLGTRESGPYSVRADLRIPSQAATFRATLCRCGASKNKPFCDNSHRKIGFSATGEPAAGQTARLEIRDGPLEIDPVLDGPLQARGNLEITSGSGRVLARVQQARLCRCGNSGNKPFCDDSHSRIGFKSE